MSEEPRWISKKAVLAIHERLLAEHGGPAGVLDEGHLEAALASPRNHWAYATPDLFRLAAAYAYALTQDHPFGDGNKRVALTVAGVFLELNGFRLEASERDATDATRALSMRELSEDDYATWLRESCVAVPRRGTKLPRPKVVREIVARKKR